jgi:hypothetical protein
MNQIKIPLDKDKQPLVILCENVHTGVYLLQVALDDGANIACPMEWVCDGWGHRYPPKAVEIATALINDAQDRIKDCEGKWDEMGRELEYAFKTLNIAHNILNLELRTDYKVE